MRLLTLGLPVLSFGRFGFIVWAFLVFRRMSTDRKTWQLKSVMENQQWGSILPNLRLNPFHGFHKKIILECQRPFVHCTWNVGLLKYVFMIDLHIWSAIFNLFINIAGSCLLALYTDQVSSPPSGVWLTLPSIGLLAAKSLVPQQTPSKPLGATASQEHQRDTWEEMELESHTMVIHEGPSGPWKQH